MKSKFESIEEFVQALSQEEVRALKLCLYRVTPHPLEVEFGTDSETILSAINRSSDLTKRGVRGILAESVFETEVLSTLEAAGWESMQIGSDLSYDFSLRRGSRTVTIQVKLQRRKEGEAMLYPLAEKEAAQQYVVEVQKTRSGQHTKTVMLKAEGAETEKTEVVTSKTRPYEFGDFDLLAVNMHPSSKKWNDFRYTLSAWLIGRKGKKQSNLIEVLQPVAAVPNDLWTDDLSLAIAWLERGEKRCVGTPRVLARGGAKRKKMNTKRKPKQLNLQQS